MRATTPLPVRRAHRLPYRSPMIGAKLSILLTLLIAQPVFAEHFNGRYLGQNGEDLQLTQRGKSVFGNFSDGTGNRTRLNGQSDGSDYVTGTLGDQQTWGSFELVYQRGAGGPDTVSMLLYRGTFEVQIGNYRLQKANIGNMPTPPAPRRPAPRQQQEQPRERTAPAQNTRQQAPPVNTVPYGDSGGQPAKQGPAPKPAAKLPY